MTGTSAGLGETAETLGELYAARVVELVRLAAVLGAEDPEDVAQEAFVRFQEHARLREPAVAAAYLRRIVVNLTNSQLRHVRVARALRLPAVDAPSAESVALLSEDERRVVRAVWGLPRRQREVLVLRYWLRRSEAEVAEILGVSVGAVKSHAARGTAKLRRELGESR